MLPRGWFIWRMNHDLKLKHQIMDLKRNKARGGKPIYEIDRYIHIILSMSSPLITQYIKREHCKKMLKD